jgi:hypothetical protein
MRFLICALERASFRHFLLDGDGVPRAIWWHIYQPSSIFAPVARHLLKVGRRGFMEMT